MLRHALTKKAHYLPALVVTLLLASALLGWAGAVLGRLPQWANAFVDTISIFSAIFLGIFIEAVPFLLLGTLASALVEVFFTRNELAAFLPRHPLLSVLAGSLLGMFFPVCECGAIPLTRRLILKGMPVSMGIAFLLAAPVINPIVIASTLAAFGTGPVFWTRLGLSLAIAVFTGAIFSLHPQGTELLRPMLRETVQQSALQSNSDRSQAESVTLPLKLQRMLVIAGDEFFEMGRFLILGALLAALLQTFVPQQAMLALGKGPLLSVLALIGLAALLSVCSTVDAFIALAFAGTFTTGSVVAFLVFGPMVDIKSTLMYLRVFNKRTVVYLILLPLMMTIVATVGLNTFAGW
ncbi:MAG: permease [Anaerolineaceae bacterium]|nr:permease [Anaerolineaceae bacterium]